MPVSPDRPSHFLCQCPRWIYNTGECWRAGGNHPVHFPDSHTGEGWWPLRVEAPKGNGALEPVSAQLLPRQPCASQSCRTAELSPGKDSYRVFFRPTPAPNCSVPSPRGDSCVSGKLSFARDLRTRSALWLNPGSSC